VIVDKDWLCYYRCWFYRLC